MLYASLEFRALRTLPSLCSKVGWARAGSCFRNWARSARAQRMPGVRHGDHHRINVLARHQLAEIVVRPAILVLVMAVDLVQRGLEMALVQVARGHDLRVLNIEQLVRVARPLDRK